ncbi:MAG: hypothetical protein Q7U91_15240 [Sideroxyarcus sp.]|nr:hypothetical protein [Sideroxyarcus sp.]
MSRNLTQPEEIDLILMTLEGPDFGQKKSVACDTPQDETGRIGRGQFADAAACANDPEHKQ